MKFGLAVTALSIAGAVLWIEQGHRIDVATPTAAFAAPVTLCPDNDSVPYSAPCIAFMQGGAASDPPGRVTAAGNAAHMLEPAEPSGPACPPNNENVPYSASCIKFMSGWFWQANAGTTAAR